MKNILLYIKDYKEPSVFKPENLLREARRQKGIPNCKIPKICVLDPDGDIVEYLIRTGSASLHTCWSCYHTIMYQFDHHGIETGIIGCAVGASFAVLLAEQMFVSGCELLISITSAGIINFPPEGKRFILIERSLRDEGTSYHYLPPEESASIHPALLNQLQGLSEHPELALTIGSSWTTDAPYRETETSIAYAKSQGVIAVEMESAALYAFAKARKKQVVCFAHLTNSMAHGKDFEKGVENGSLASLEVIYQTIINTNPNGAITKDE